MGAHDRHHSLSRLPAEPGYARRAQTSWQDPDFHVKFATIETPPPEVEAVHPDRARLDVTVVRGVAEQRTYAFVAARIDLGRCAEVKDGNGRLIRTNDVAFIEGSGDVNQSVSRQHAHITYQTESKEYRLYDDVSAHGTHIVRQGRTVTVPIGSRGVRLKAGDEIVLRDARTRIRIVWSSPVESRHQPMT